MTIDDLKTLGDRLQHGPVPTQTKKVYAYLGRIQPLFEAIPGAVVIRGSVLDACAGGDVPTQEEAIPPFLQEQLIAYVQSRRQGRETSIFILNDAEVLARYRLPMTFLYPLAGDSHAIILCVTRGRSPQGWEVPSYVRFTPDDTTDFFERTLGEQCIYQANMED
jgi:hypothetical protein